MPRKKQDEAASVGIEPDIDPTIPGAASGDQDLDTAVSSENTGGPAITDAGGGTGIPTVGPATDPGNATGTLDEDLPVGKTNGLPAGAGPASATINETVAGKKRASRTKAIASPEPDADAPVPQNDPDPQAVPPPPEGIIARPARKRNILDLNLNELDRDLPADDRKAWQAIYASYRSKSIMAGTVIGVDLTTLDVMNLETREVEKATLSSLVIIDHRVKVLIPETEMWMPGTERPPHVMRSMAGGAIDYVIMEVDREGECAIGSRRAALAAKRHFFSRTRGGHHEGELMKCRVVVTGAKRCTVECSGYDIELSQRDLSYTAIADLREHYRPGQELDCLYKGFDRENDTLVISVKETKANPFVGADNRHPIGSRRVATISGKYAGGVFCTLPDDTVCLCLYSAQHSDLDFDLGSRVIIVIRQYNYDRQLIFGRILSKW